MKNEDLKKIFKIEDIMYLPEAIQKVIFGDRNIIYNQLVSINNNDMSYDWFQGIYEEELSQRNQNKQDFTPNMVGILLSELTGTDQGNVYEPTAGNGSLIISNWWFRKSSLGENFDANNHPVTCWELSDRSIPILLLNLSIRGIRATIYHGDVLTQVSKNKYELHPDSSGFSDIIKY